MESASLRHAYGKALVELGERNRDIVVLEADLGRSTMSCLFQERFPDRYFEMGIAEQNMASTAAGLSLTGKIPFVHSFAVFASGRMFDQVRQAICIPSLNVKICGSSAGLSDFGDGSTHQSVEDVAIMRAIPNMTVVIPADAVQADQVVSAAAAHEGPVYIRISRGEYPIYTPRDLGFRIGALYELRGGNDAAVFASGGMVAEAMEAARLLESEGISTMVVNVSTVKPLDAERIREIAGRVKAVVSAEEHAVIGGLGSSIAEVLMGKVDVGYECVGIRDRFGTSAAGYAELLEEYGLTAAEIVRAVKRSLR